MPHVPVRTCSGCRRRRPRPELIRVALSGTGVRLDPAGRLPGRGAYLCAESARECLRAAQRHRGMARSLRANRDVIDYSELEKQLDAQEKLPSPPLSKS